MQIAVSRDNARILFGTEKLLNALKDCSIKFTLSRLSHPEIGDNIILVGTANDGPVFKNELKQNWNKSESFAIISKPHSCTIIAGSDDAGIMYGCLELADRIRQSKSLPAGLDIHETPALSLRGTCILLMKLGLYDFAITPQEFPFFYDRQLWTDYLDFLARNRYNFISFWNGHPFDYFVKLDNYPEAQDGMPPGLLEKNHETLMWLSKEAQKRNIWLLFEFYNIHTSVYFAKAHNLPEHGISKPTPLLRDYTSYAIERFVSEFPSVGLYICPGESLEMQCTDDWINNVIFTAVKKTGKNPPIIIRSWGIDLEHVKKTAPNYSALYTERKYNFEHLVATDIDPENKDWSTVTGNHLVNIHLVGNLEPFRWSPPSYIQKCVKNSIHDGGATGMHIYPRKTWRWPYGCDKTETPQLQWHRDWMWFETWARYCWNPDREPDEDKQYWISRLASRYGSADAAQHVLNSCEFGADVLPALQRLFWPGMDNHTIATAGMSLAHMQKTAGVPFLKVPGMIRMPDYIQAIKNCKELEGNTPDKLLAEKVLEAKNALEQALLAVSEAKSNKDELQRIAQDANAVLLLAEFYRIKIRAAVAKSLCDAGVDKESNKIECITALGESVKKFRQLTELTSQTYESLSDVASYTPEPVTSEIPSGNLITRVQHINSRNGTGLPSAILSTSSVKGYLVPFHWSDVLPILESEFSRVKSELQKPD